MSLLLHRGRGGNSYKAAARAFSSLCTTCVHQHSKLACNPCQYLEDISALKRVNYFQFFCMEPRFDIDYQALAS